MTILFGLGEEDSLTFIGEEACRRPPDEEDEEDTIRACVIPSEPDGDERSTGAGDVLPSLDEDGEMSGCGFGCVPEPGGGGTSKLFFFFEGASSFAYGLVCVCDAVTGAFSSRILTSLLLLRTGAC